MPKVCVAAVNHLISKSNSMGNEREIIILQRDVHATMVPYGTGILLQKGTEVVVTQALGTSFTVEVYGNLARIDGKDADALGKKTQSPLDDLPENASIEDKVWTQLKTVYDPEIPVNIVDLGLVYDVAIQKQEDATYHIKVKMTLTAPGCGMGPVIAQDAEQKLEIIKDVSKVEVEVVFDPPWSREMMSEEAKLELGLF